MGVGAGKGERACDWMEVGRDGDGDFEAPEAPGRQELGVSSLRLHRAGWWVCVCVRVCVLHEGVN